jgi:penicillin-binding protein 1C
MAQDWHRFKVNWNPQQWAAKLHAKPYAKPLKVLLGLGVGVLIGRSLPYLAPIRAADLAQTQQAAEFIDRNGLPLGTILTRDQDHTVSVPLSQVSPHFLQAIVAAEDQRFYQHGALDERAIIRALLEAAQAKQIVSGASTITMQLARMLDGSPRTAQGKLQEIWTSWRLTAGMGKDEILQAYLNRLPMGGNIYGVEAASRIYFGIPASDLTLAQASLLAGIPNDPNQLNPYDHLLSLKKRQAYVLDRMVQDGYISQVQRDRAYTEETALQSRQQGIVAAPHFLFWLTDQLPANHPAQVRTTIDRPLQQFVEAQVLQVVRSLAPHNVHHAAVLVLDNKTGEVLSYVGSPDYFATPQLGQNDGVQALRQPGSTLKPFLYQLALENRIIQPNTILADVPTRYAIPGARLYSPSDYSETFQGPVRVRVALANSLNVPAVKVLEKVGVNAFLDRLHQLGFNHLTETPEYYGLGLTLGSGEVSLWELAQAYLTLARQGQRTPLRVWNTEFNQSPPPLTPHLTHSPATWLLVTDMLSDRHARSRAFGVNSLLALPFPAAVKTGTSSDYRDTWTVGFTTDYTVAVWVGNFDSAPMQKVSGVMGAAPLWNRIMLHLHEQKEPKPFQVPDGMVQRPICAVSGARPIPACPAIVQEYLFSEDLAAYEQEGDRFFPAVKGQNGTVTHQLKLPADYNEWLARQPKALSSSTTNLGLRIVSPRAGDRFVIGQDHASQRLEFKLVGASTAAMQWSLNGQLLPASRSGSFFWKPQPGTWTLQVKQGQQTDQVRFEVETAIARPARKGFSFSSN